MFRDTDGWVNTYKEKGALWIHNGNNKSPHALLTSGKHSTGFFNSRLIIADELILRKSASDLVELLIGFGVDISEVGCVVGPQTGATKLAELTSDQIKTITNSECFWVSPAKGEVRGQKAMIFNNEDIALVTGQTILLCEDVLTTGGSVELASIAVENIGGNVLPFVLVLVNRSGLSEVGGRKIISLIDRHMPTWIEEECPLCKVGSKTLRPKDNWAELTSLKSVSP